jgi:hypothetical protein
MSDLSITWQLTDRRLTALLASELAILILTRRDCGACVSYQAEIETRLVCGELAGIAIGKLLLDQGGAAQFKQANPWLTSLQVLPFTLLYQHGKQIDAFAGTNGSDLLERIDDILAAQPAPL